MSSDPAIPAERDALSSYLAAVRRRWLLVVAIVLAFVAVAGLRHVTETRTYEATASVAFGSSSLSDAALQVNRSTGDPEREAATNVLVAQSEEVAGRVAEQLGVDDPGDLLAQISVEAAENADVLYITASNDDPAASAQLANAFAEQYIAFQAATQTESVQKTAADLREQLDALPADSPQRAALEDSLQRLTSLQALAGGTSQLIGRATVPSTPTGLGLFALLVVAALLGIAVAAIVVFVLESIDRRVRSIEDFEREYRVRALTAIPQESFSSRGAAERNEALEPYRILRTALEFVGATRRLNTLLITSAVPGEGKTTVAVDLAHAVALTGRRVALVELDLRRPSFSRHFPLERPTGLTSALIHRRPLSEVMVRPYPSLRNLHVLPAGRLPPNPAELLGTEALADLLVELAEDDTMVILDAPPLNPVADTQALMNRSEIDGALIVARLDHTTRDEARRARSIVDRHLVEPVGLAVTGLRESRRYGYGYGDYTSIDPGIGTDTVQEAAPVARSRLRRSAS